MVNIKKQLVPNSIGRRVTAGYNNSKKYITIHQTGNTSRGADAQAHANLQSKGNGRNASWQYQVDDKGTIQSFDDNAQCFHAGDGRGPGNMSSIGIELCINSDGDYRKTVGNGAELVRHLMDKHNIPISNVKQHNHWSGKNCPAQIRANKDGISWKDFLNMIQGKTVTAQAPKQQVKSTTKTISSKTKANLKVDGYWGRDTTRALQKALGTPVDGEIWGQVRNAVTKNITGGVKYGKGGSPMIKKLQSKVGSKADGYLGANTIRSMQRYLKTPADGELWKPSTMVKELQRRLNAGTF